MPCDHCCYWILITSEALAGEALGPINIINILHHYSHINALNLILTEPTSDLYASFAAWCWSIISSETNDIRVYIYTILTQNCGMSTHVFWRCRTSLVTIVLKQTKWMHQLAGMPFFNAVASQDIITLGSLLHDDVIKWKHFPRYWPFVWGIHPSPVHLPDKGHWRGYFLWSVLELTVEQTIDMPMIWDRIHKRHPIARPNGVPFVNIVDRIDRNLHF